MKTTKCYIATYYNSDNYGTRLQNFALEYTLKSLGVTPVTIYIKDLKVDIKQKIKTFLTKLPNITSYQKKWSNLEKKEEIFKDFNSKINFEKLTYKELYNKDFKNAFAVVGSDQVWLPYHLTMHPKEEQLYFLKFIEKNKRYSYAPSFGVSSLEEDKKEMYKMAFKDFNKITVREQDGAAIIKELINEEVSIMPDPVFLLTSKEWTANLPKIEKNKFILVYFLDEISEDENKKINEYAKENKFEIVYISGNNISENKLLPSPEEFLALIANSEYIFTDSFHGCSFSIIMNKSFSVFQRKTVKQFSRIKTLLNKYKCENCIVENVSDVNIKNMPLISKDVIKVHAKERNLGLEFLTSIIKEEELKLNEKR